MVTVLRLKEIPVVIEALAQKITGQKFAPDHILYIESAGRLLGQQLAGQLNCTYSGIYASRKGGKIKKLLEPVFRFFPVWLTHQLRRLELGSGFHKRNQDRHVSLGFPLPSHARKLLIIDDAVDTGHSMQATVNFMKKNGFDRSDIMTVTITVTGKEIVHVPDVALYQVLITFPWSPGSQDWNAYQKKINEIK